MTALLRTASSPLKAAIEAGQIRGRADLFTFTLRDGTILRWTSWDRDLVVSGMTYSSKAPWLERGNWDVSNTMQVPSMAVTLRAFNAGFAGGAAIQAQIHNGLFAGAVFSMARAYMVAPPTVLGVLGLFGGKVGGIDVSGATATLTIKGKTNDLDQYAPRNLYQIGCNHRFCDPGCALLAAAYTADFAVGSSGLSATFIPWASAPGSPGLYQRGTITMTSGAAAGQTRTVAAADSSGLTLAYPLYRTPAPGDTFSGFQGCDKTYDSGSGQSCTDRSNTQHYRGYEYVPPPNSAY